MRRWKEQEQTQTTCRQTCREEERTAAGDPDLQGSHPAVRSWSTGSAGSTGIPAQKPKLFRRSQFERLLKSTHQQQPRLLWTNQRAGGPGLTSRPLTLNAADLWTSLNVSPPEAPPGRPHLSALAPRTTTHITDVQTSAHSSSWASAPKAAPHVVCRVSTGLHGNQSSAGGGRWGGAGVSTPTLRQTSSYRGYQRETFRNVPLNGSTFYHVSLWFRVPQQTSFWF